MDIASIKEELSNMLDQLEQAAKNNTNIKRINEEVANIKTLLQGQESAVLEKSIGIQESVGKAFSRDVIGRLDKLPRTLVTMSDNYFSETRTKIETSVISFFEKEFAKNKGEYECKTPFAAADIAVNSLAEQLATPKHEDTAEVPTQADPEIKEDIYSRLSEGLSDFFDDMMYALQREFKINEIPFEPAKTTLSGIAAQSENIATRIGNFIDSEIVSMLAQVQIKSRPWLEQIIRQKISPFAAELKEATPQSPNAQQEGLPTNVFAEERLDDEPNGSKLPDNIFEI